MLFEHDEEVRCRPRRLDLPNDVSMLVGDVENIHPV
jgi:hypothetical protein